ncbi:MAG: His/Gly/Thr/Pro-type tRNA ligase C-terminal domain-containing protein [Armatimonadetes bacterium]|nr:His/Gly/Thr/Pro-type tRNA ligase C-terminal domain-containing protein [Armatimonadota bacterium]
MHLAHSTLVTSREPPADAGTLHERLLHRAGFLRKAQAGSYLFLPLGARVLRRMVDVLERECSVAGFQPVVLPLARMVQALTEAARPHVRSWRTLPLRWYSLQRLISEDVEPRGGLLQTRENLLLQLWSWDADSSSASTSVTLMRDVLLRACRQMGMAVLAAQSEGWFLLAEAEEGEESLCQCTSCATAAAPAWYPLLSPAEEPTRPEGVPPAQVVRTPNLHTVEEVSCFLNVQPTQVVKTLLLEVDGQAVAALVRGDHELSLVKVARTMNARTVQMMSAERVESVSKAPLGFAGPVGLEDVILIADWAVRQIQGFVVGANLADAHRVHVCWGRDFAEPLWADLRAAGAGDRCAHCGGTLIQRRGICVGEVRPWQEEHGLMYDDAQGRQQPVQVVLAELNLLRTLAALAETSCDRDGLVWHLSIAPFQATILLLNPAEQAQREAAEKIYQHLRAYEVDVLLDDRDERAGVKFKDADLIGIPIQVVVGRTAAAGTVEVRLRRDRQPRQVAIEDAPIVVQELLHRELGNEV